MSVYLDKTDYTVIGPTKEDTVLDSGWFEFSKDSEKLRGFHKYRRVIRTEKTELDHSVIDKIKKSILTQGQVDCVRRPENLGGYTYIFTNQIDSGD